jgi:uncharacterized membrane protein
MAPGSRSLDRVRLVLAVIGLAIAGYLTLQHYDGGLPLACGQGSFVDCETVLTSPSSMVLGLPVAMWGIAWFGVAVALSVPALRGPPSSSSLHYVRFAWTLVGTATVLWLVYQELGIIGKICAWCTGIHVLVLALLVVEVRAHEGAAPVPT